MISLSESDKKLLYVLQYNFPLVREPWKTIAESLGMSEEEVLKRVKQLMDEGIIRRIGPIFDARKIGFGASTLVAAKVPSEDIERIAGIISQFENVTHNYQRKHEYNLWFTVLAKNHKDLQLILEKIKSITGLKDILDLPTSKSFKTDVRFDFGEK